MSTNTDLNEITTAAYKNPDLSIEERLDDLLEKMTLEEKAAQMVGIWNEKANTLLDENGRFDLEKARKSFGHGHGLGQVGRPNEVVNGKPAGEIAELTNQIQKFFMEESRLGIPVIFHEECLHGLAAMNATSFPQPIALAGTFNTDLVREVYAIAALEARVRGGHQALTPVADISRDPRWGRVEETFGEDPYLVGKMAAASVKGFQGDLDFSQKKNVLATLKHFVAHGDPEAGMNCGPANISMRELREVHLAPFKTALDEAGAVSIMASYNEIDGVPSHANRWLLQELLREEWGFEGFVVSDYYALWELADRPDTHGHHVAHNVKEAAKLAAKAGVNIELPEPNAYKHLVELVNEGKLNELRLDELVRPMLYWKFRLGLFDDPFIDPEKAEKISGSKAHRPAAQKSAQECVTLLKNENNILPLNLESISTIAVIGPNANRSLLGGYSGRPVHEVTFLDGIKEYADEKANVLYHEGCKITIGGSWEQDEVVPADPAENRKMIAEAKKIAEKADVIVLAIGGNDQTSRESWALNHMGDRTNIDLVGEQKELVEAMEATGKPVIAFLFNGKPLSVNVVEDKASAILECWYIGQETGNTAASILFGDVNPGGKLPISFPRSVGHIPAYYNHKPSARRGYLFDEVSPLYPFGFGLSYTTFKIENLRLASDSIKPDGETEVLVDVTNTGEREGSEVVQLYIRDKVSSVTRPVKELKGFKKVWLKPGESQTVGLPITPGALAFFDINMEYRVEPGEFEIMVGNSSQDSDLIKTILTVTE